jgi:hypothetical protein
MNLKKGRSAENSAYAQKGTTSRVTVDSRPRVSFNQMAAPVPEIMDGSFTVFCICSFYFINVSFTYFDLLLIADEEQVLWFVFHRMEEN